MKKRILLMALAIGLVFALAGCVGLGGGGSIRGEGPMVLHTVDAANFTGIDVGGAYDITWIYSPTFNVTFEMQQNLWDLVETNVSNSVLVISQRSGFTVNGGNTPRLRIYAPYIDSIVLSGAAYITGWDALDQESMYIRISGAADIALTGSVEHLNINSSGASNVNLFELAASHAVINVSGASHVEVYAANTLDVTLSGVGTIIYDGNPALTRNVSGLGVVRAR